MLDRAAAGVLGVSRSTRNSTAARRALEGLVERALHVRAFAAYSPPRGVVEPTRTGSTSTATCRSVRSTKKTRRIHAVRHRRASLLRTRSGRSANAVAGGDSAARGRDGTGAPTYGRLHLRRRPRPDWICFVAGRPFSLASGGRPAGWRRPRGRGPRPTRRRASGRSAIRTAAITAAIRRRLCGGALGMEGSCRAHEVPCRVGYRHRPVHLDR